MEDAGVKVISQWWRWVYLQKKASDGPFEMYTDIDSKITQYSKISKFLSIFLPIEFFGFLYELFGAIYLKSYILAVFAVALAIISLSILKIIWKCKWKIKEYKKQENV